MQTDTLCAMQQQELQKLHRACEDKSRQVECLTFDIKIVRGQQQDADSKLREQARVVLEAQWQMEQLEQVLRQQQQQQEAND